MRLPAKAGLHDDIIRVCIEVGSEQGEEGLTMRAVAKRLDVSVTALYQHFENKGAILREVRVHGVRVLHAYLTDAVPGDDQAQRICEIARAYVKFARLNPWLYKVLFCSDEIEWESLTRDEMDEALLPMTLVRQTFAEGVKSGAFCTSLDVEQAIFVTWASLHGLVSLMLQGRIRRGHPAFPVDEDAFVEVFVRNLVHGFVGARTGSGGGLCCPEAP